MQQGEVAQSLKVNFRTESGRERRTPAECTLYYNMRVLVPLPTCHYVCKDIRYSVLESTFQVMLLGALTVQRTWMGGREFRGGRDSLPSALIETRPPLSLLPVNHIS